MLNNDYSNYDASFDYITGALIKRTPVNARRYQMAVNLSAPRLQQRVPQNSLPGTVIVYGWTNIPRRKAAPQVSATVLPMFQNGVIGLGTY